MSLEHKIKTKHQKCYHGEQTILSWTIALQWQFIQLLKLCVCVLVRKIALKVQFICNIFHCSALCSILCIVCNMWCKIQHWDTGTVNLQLWCSAAAMLAHCGCNSGRVQLKLWCNSGAWKLQLWCIAAATLVQWKLSGCAGQVLSCISGKPHELNHY